MSEYKIIPYIEVNGMRTLSDGTVKAIWEQMRQENIVKRMFYDGSVCDEMKFLAWMKSPHKIIHTMWDEGEIAALCLLTGYNGHSAIGHYCIFKKFLREKANEIAKQAIEYWFSWKTKNGEPALHSIVGFTPDNNRLAIKMLPRMGFTIVGTIPDLAWNAYKKKRVGITISYRRRQENGD